MSITNIGMSGLLAAQAGLGMSARNTANLLTTGYTRQGVLLTPRMAGGGVELGSFLRFTDNYKTQHMWASHAALGQYGVGESYYKQLEEVMGLGDGSVKAGIDGFFAALDEVSTDPTSTALRQQVISAADAMAKSFNALRQAMTRQLDTARQQSMATAEQVNMLSTNIADLNRQIELSSATGTVPSELIDQRDQAVDQLSKLVDIQVLRQPDGTVDVSIANGPPLIAGGQVGKLGVTPHADGTYSIALELVGASYPLDAAKLGGELGGLGKYVADTLLPQMESNKILAAEFAAQVNDKLTTGFGTNGEPGKPLFDFNPTTGTLSIHPGITHADLGFSASPTDPGNSDNLLGLIELRKGKITMPLVGEVSLGDAYTMLVGKLGSDSQHNQNALDRATEIRKQAELDWLAVSGVSMEEESVKISEYLNMYNANMKVISVANELFESTINML